MASGSISGSYAYLDHQKGVYYGPGSVKTALPKVLKETGAKAALIVTGNTLRTKTSVIATVEDILKEHNAYGGTFSEIGEHGPIAGIRNGIKAIQSISADLLIGVGGGSPVCAAKAMIYLYQKQTNGPFIRQIAIPTALSAAEYTAGGGYKDDDGNKVRVASPELAPYAVILDAELTLPTPERLWLSTGMRAVDHTVENLYRPGVSVPAKILCYAALADLFTYLPKCKADPSDVAARQKLQVASWLSLWPTKFANNAPPGLSHGLGHKLGARYNIPHGITSCLTLSPVVHLKASIASEQDKADLARALFYLGIKSTGSVEGDIHLLADRIQNLVDSLGLTSKISSYRVPEGDLPGIAEKTLGSTSDPIYPQVAELLKSIY